MIKELTKGFKTSKSGSALIMTIVLTVLLAVIAIMFVAVARMDKAATSNIYDNKMLDSAAKSIIEIIGRELVLDAPGIAGRGYYDYPDSNNPWLASIEPYEAVPNDPNTYRWRQISDVNGYLKSRNFQRNDVNTAPYGLSTTKVVREYPEFAVDSNGRFLKPNGSPATNGVSADADGDGIADAKWFEFADMRTSKGQRIYAAVRVIDNSGMINVNTAHSFNANTADGNSQMQINLAGLLKGTDTIAKLHQIRCGSEPNNWTNYKKNVIWDYNSIPGGNYLPFDISDELELRYRYCIDSKFISRFEVNDPCSVRGVGKRNFGNLYNGDTDVGTDPCSSNWRLSDWQHRIVEPNYPYADRRHLLTAYNLDRIIDPNGNKMININTADVNSLYKSIRRGLLDANSGSDVNGIAAQMAVNIIDYRDSDSNVTVYRNDGNDYYGFERPCIYISELACRQVKISGTTHKSYAVELYRPYPEDKVPNGWQLNITNVIDSPIDINWSGTKQFYVITWEDSDAPLSVNNSDANVRTMDNPGNSIIFNPYEIFYLTRNVKGTDVTVDFETGSDTWPVADGNYSVQRDITKHKCIRRLWGDSTIRSSMTLGKINDYNTAGDSNIINVIIPAHPANEPFTNIGQIGTVLCRSGYEDITPIGPSDTQATVYFNLAAPDFQQIFKYLTVMDPRNHISDANQTRIKGRININTAPAYAIAQLPWVTHRAAGYNDANLAKAIVAYRDKTAITSDVNYTNRQGGPGFESIGQLCNVNRGSDPNYRIDYYGRDKKDQIGLPDPNGNDGAIDDFKERDLIFARISDLVTVHSDIFTAYILVRIGVDGPQKRYMTILDRSGIKPPITDPNNRVAVRAFQYVPEAR